MNLLDVHFRASVHSEDEEEDMATIIENQLTWVKELTCAVEKASQDLAALKAEHGQALAQLRASIQAGGTTGDPLRDLVICECGRLDPERERLCRPYTEALSGKRGEFALIEYLAQYSNKFGWGRNEYRWKLRVRLSVLADDMLVCNEKIGVTLPTDRFLAADEVTLNCFSEKTLLTKLSRIEGNILGRDFSEEDMSPRSLTDFKLGESLYVGDEAVRAFLASHGAASFFEYAARQLDRQALPLAA